MGKPFKGEYSDMQDCSISLDERIPKSTWVEDILPKIGYKNVALVKLPILELPILLGLALCIKIGMKFLG